MIYFSFLDVFLLFNTRLLKFGLVGVSGMVVDFGLTWLCKEKLKWNRYLANSIGFSTAVINNFLINRYWTFSDSTVHDTPRQFTSFAGIALIGLGLNNLIVYFFHKKAGLNFYVSKLIAIALVFIWNYFANIYFTFKVA